MGVQVTNLVGVGVTPDVGVTGMPGMINFCPMLSIALMLIPLALAISSLVVSYLTAMLLKVSPCATVCTNGIKGVMLGAGEGVGDRVALGVTLGLGVGVRVMVAVGLGSLLGVALGTRLPFGASPAAISFHGLISQVASSRAMAATAPMAIVHSPTEEGGASSWRVAPQMGQRASVANMRAPHAGH